MSEKLERELEWLNENLKSAVINQDMIYLELKQIEKVLKRLHEQSSDSKQGDG